MYNDPSFKTKLTSLLFIEYDFSYSFIVLLNVLFSSDELLSFSNKSVPKIFNAIKLFGYLSINFSNL